MVLTFRLPILLKLLQSPMTQHITRSLLDTLAGHLSTTVWLSLWLSLSHHPCMATLQLSQLLLILLGSQMLMSSLSRYNPGCRGGVSGTPGQCVLQRAVLPGFSLQASHCIHCAPCMQDFRNFHPKACSPSCNNASMLLKKCVLSTKSWTTSASSTAGATS